MIRFLLFSLQGILMIFVLSLCYVSFGPRTAIAANFEVTSYGAKGDGNTDDSKAFLQAWADLCKDTSPNPTLIVPSGKTFLIGPVSFNGPCKSPTVNVKLLGNIIAPKTISGWKDCIKNAFWIFFMSVRGLRIEGPGQIDGQGSIWWGKKKALHFHACNGLRLRGTTHINSPKMHISVNGCEDVDIGHIGIIAPANSPNTDGIDISKSSHVNIHDSNIQTGIVLHQLHKDTKYNEYYRESERDKSSNGNSNLIVNVRTAEIVPHGIFTLNNHVLFKVNNTTFGDDCVAINGGIFDANVTGVSCGPGHGISIGSLGENRGHDTVEKVLVENCIITGTENGLRIKTVPFGTGFARGIVYRKIHLVNVRNPIIIDQHYCSNSESVGCPSPVGLTSYNTTVVLLYVGLSSPKCIQLYPYSYCVYPTSKWIRIRLEPGVVVDGGSCSGGFGGGRRRNLRLDRRVGGGFGDGSGSCGGGHGGGVGGGFGNGGGGGRKRESPEKGVAGEGCRRRRESPEKGPSTPAVQVSNVKYDNIHGSSASAQAITFRCSGKFKCTGIQTNGVGITGNNVFSVCKNVEGNFVDTNPPIKCSQ
ncbi:hypothetical protein OSB04_009782, partial [Centaurea solstitialis]